MGIHINESLPMLETILEQQQRISDKLLKLTLAFKREPEPVAPVLRSMLKPLNDAMADMGETLSHTSTQGHSSASQSEL